MSAHFIPFIPDMRLRDEISDYIYEGNITGIQGVLTEAAAPKMVILPMSNVGNLSIPNDEDIIDSYYPFAKVVSRHLSKIIFDRNWIDPDDISIYSANTGYYYMPDERIGTPEIRFFYYMVRGTNFYDNWDDNSGSESDLTLTTVDTPRTSTSTPRTRSNSIPSDWSSSTVPFPSPGTIPQPPSHPPPTARQLAFLHHHGIPSSDTDEGDSDTPGARRASVTSGREERMSAVRRLFDSEPEPESPRNVARTLFGGKKKRKKTKKRKKVAKTKKRSTKKSKSRR